MKKAAIFTPYLATLGGGERYALTLAQVLLDNNWHVEVTLTDQAVLKKARQRFNLPLEKLRLIKGDLLATKSLFKRLFNHRQYDLLFWVSDGSVPLMFAKKNILHFQVPFHNVNKNPHFNRMKFYLIDKIACNSYFTKQIIDKEFNVKSSVWYPPVGVEEFNPNKKENIILSVGRFEESMNIKRQDILVEIFKKLCDGGLKNWRFVLIGGSAIAEKNNKFLQELRKTSRNYPIELKVNASFETLKKFYGRAKIFWHAAGFGFDEKTQPEKMEHFGMSTIEAMSAGCWPLVYDAGGQKEIFKNFSQQGMILWQSPEQLIQKTLKVIKRLQNKKLLTQETIKLAQKFSIKAFKKNVQPFL